MFLGPQRSVGGGGGGSPAQGMTMLPLQLVDGTLQSAFRLTALKVTFTRPLPIWLTGITK